MIGDIIFRGSKPVNMCGTRTICVLHFVHFDNLLIYCTVRWIFIKQTYKNNPFL
jgi:hypothetical protein